MGLSLCWTQRRCSSNLSFCLPNQSNGTGKYSKYQARDGGCELFMPIACKQTLV